MVPGMTKPEVAGAYITAQDSKCSALDRWLLQEPRKALAFACKDKMRSHIQRLDSHIALNLHCPMSQFSRAHI